MKKDDKHAWVLIHYASYEGFDRPAAVFTEYPAYKQLKPYGISMPLYERMSKKQDYDMPYEQNVDGWCIFKMTLNGSK